MGSEGRRACAPTPDRVTNHEHEQTHLWTGTDALCESRSPTTASGPAESTQAAKALCRPVLRGSCSEAKGEGGRGIVKRAAAVEGETMQSRRKRGEAS